MTPRSTPRPAIAHTASSAASHTARTRRRAGALAVALLATLGLAACGGEESPTAGAAEAIDSAGRPAFGLVSPGQAADLAVDADVVVIDVRTPEEFAEGHIDGAELIDFYEPTFADSIAALDRDANYLVYCRSDNRSGQAVGLMRSLGFTNVWDMDGGVQAWVQEGRPLVR
jgi:phage shock protein E